MPHKPKASTWRKHVIDLAKELHIYDQMAILSKETLKHRIQKEIETKILEEIDNEAEIKTKIYHWKERKKEIKVGTRPKYMDKLNRKQCNAILRARSSMLMVEENYKKQYESNLLCRFCDKYNETQEHILLDCTKIKRTKEKIIYSKIFEEDTEPLREIANEIIKIDECLKEQQLHSMSSSNRSEPSGWPGRMHRSILLPLHDFGDLLTIVITEVAHFHRGL